MLPRGRIKRPPLIRLSDTASFSPKYCLYNSSHKRKSDFELPRSVFGTSSRSAQKTLEDMASSPKTILATANTSWFLYNFKIAVLRRLRALGWRIVVAAPPDEYSIRLKDCGFEFRPLDVDSKGTNPLRDFQLLRAYVSVMRETNADLVLSFTIKPIVYGSLAARYLGIPVIPTITGLGSSFIRGGPIIYIVKRLYRTALSGAAHVFFLNADDLRRFRSESLIRNGQRFGLVPGSGVDPEHFAPRPRKEDGKFTFLLAARMLRDKGVGEYVEAARRIRRRFPDTRFLLLGKADVDNPTAISRLQLEQWTREGDAQYLGETDDVRPYIAASDAVVLPSYREGLPRVLLEAASMMRPIVTTDTPGCRDVVTHGHNGLLCKARDAADLTSVLEKMLSLPASERQRMAVCGREMVIERFGEERVVAEYIQAVERVAERWPLRKARPTK